ncbi:MAG: helix-turn-helix transcriptional regulator [Sandaracinaceae bacterium]|nr:helix-turn-helix transcriptional regulator [Sandaracinaceae bacterium]
MDSDRHALELADLATRATSRDELRRETLARLERIVGLDVAIAWGFGEDEATIAGFDLALWQRFRAHSSRYAGDVGALLEGAARARGVVRDVDALDARRREASPFYAEIVRPAGSCGFLTCVLEVRGARVAALQLGRARRRGPVFRSREAEALRRLLPVLALGEAIHTRPTPTPDARLTPRENELLRYLALGLTNREIALACGTSPNTVRNQLAGIFRKAAVSTRSELVAWSLGALDRPAR